MQLDLLEFPEIHPVFYVSLLQYEASNLLPRQHQEPQKPVIALEKAK